MIQNIKKEEMNFIFDKRDIPRCIKQKGDKKCLKK